MYRTPQQLNSGNFDTFLANYPGPVLAEFWAPSCPHCLSFAPTVRIVADKLAGKAAVVQINTQDSPVLASRFAVRGIPAIIFFRNARVVDQLTGVRSAEELLAWFRRHA
jgi:thioredoxin 2